MIKRSFVILLLSILVAAAPAAAQEGAGAWTAWLYEPQTGTVTLVDQSGAVVNEFRLPLAQAFDAYSFSIAVTPSGSHIAYIGSDSSADTPNRQLFVYSLSSSSITASYPLNSDAVETSLELMPRVNGFDEDTNRLAVGSLIWADEADSDPGWEVVVLDYRLGDIIAEVSSDDVQIEGLDWNLFVPVIQRFEADTVIFSSVFYATELLAEYLTFAWDITSGEVTLTPETTSSFVRGLPATSEQIAPLLDERLPFAELPDDLGPIPVTNTVQVYDPVTETRYPFYAEEDRTILNVEFVQNGERVLIQTYTAESMGIDETRWVILERDGTVINDEVLIPPDVANVFNTPDGFAYLGFVPETPGASLVTVNTRDGSFAENVIWTGAAEDNPLLAYIRSDAPPTDEFTPWAQLAEPVPFGN